MKLREKDQKERYIKMKHLGNDICHIFCAVGILAFTTLGWWGYVLSGFAIGWLVETKEEDSNVLKVTWDRLSMRDMLGYAIGGAIVGLIVRGGDLWIL